MAREDRLRLHVGGTGHGGVEVVDFEPQQQAVAVGLVLRVTDRPVVMLDLKAVELEDQHIIADQSFIDRPAVGASSALSGWGDKPGRAFIVNESH